MEHLGYHFGNIHQINIINGCLKFSAEAFIVDSLRLRATVLHSHSHAFSWTVLHCFGSLGRDAHRTSD